MAQNNQNQQTDTGGNNNIDYTINLFLHGVDVGTIVEIGTANSFFGNQRLTNVPSVEELELVSQINPISSAHPQMLNKCFQFPGYRLSTNSADTYEESLINPLGGYGALSHTSWNTYFADSSWKYEGSNSSVYFTAPAQNNTWNWTTYLQVLLNHNRISGLPMLLDESSHLTRCKQIIRGVGNGNPPYEWIPVTTPLIKTRMLLREWHDTSLQTTDDWVEFYWVAQCNGHVNGITGDPTTDFRLLDSSGTPIEFGTFPGMEFGAALTGTYTNPNGQTFGIEGNIYDLYQVALPYGMPKLVIPFRRPLSVTFDDCFADGAEYQGALDGEGITFGDFSETLGFRQPRVFPFTGLHNPTGQVTDGFPHKGFAPGDEPNDALINAYESQDNYIQDTADQWGPYIWGIGEFSSYQDRHRLFGINNGNLSLQGFFINDYDLANIYEYDSHTGFPINHNADTYQANMNIYNQIINHPNISLQNKQKVYLMRQRYAMTALDGWGQATGGFLPSIQSVLDAYQMSSGLNSSNSLMIDINEKLCPLGPPAPAGYDPIVGHNWEQFFGISADENISFSDGYVPFYFSNSLNFNVTDETTTDGFNNSALINSFNNYCAEHSIQISGANLTNLFHLCQEFVDRKIWEWCFDAYVVARQLYSGSSPTPTPTELFILSESGTGAITLQMIQENESLSAADKDKVTLFRLIVMTLYSMWLQQYNSENGPAFNHPNHLFAPFTGQWSESEGATTEEQSTLNDISYPPHAAWETYVENGWSDWIKLAIITLPTNYGGIQMFETYNFIIYCASGGTIYIPNDTYQATPSDNFLPDAMTSDVDWGVFYQPMGYILEPGWNTITYYGPDFTGTNPWAEAAYINENFDGLNGQIEFINFGSSQSLIYSYESITTDEGNFVTGFYPSSATGETILKYGQEIQVKVSEQQVEFETMAFGSPIENVYNYWFSTNTTMYQMVQTLMMAGYNGTTLDANGDGDITLADGMAIANALDDYRPYQFIQWAQQIGQSDIIYQYFPPNGMTINPLTQDEIQEFGLPPMPSLFYAPAGSVKTFDAIQNLTHNRTRGYFKGNPALNEIGATTMLTATNGNSTLPNYEGTNASQNEIGARYINGNQIFTQSRNPSNDPYNYVILDGDPSNADSEPIFSVSFGQREGSGSRVSGNGKSAAYAIYKQWANTLLGTERGEFFSISGSLRGTDLAPSDNVNSNSPISDSNRNPDEYIYVLSSIKKGDAILDKNIPDWQITLSGSNLTGGGATVSFVSDYEFNKGGYYQSNGLLRYNIIRKQIQGDGSNQGLTPPSSASYGHFYPDMGVWVFNEMVVRHFGGQGSTDVVDFNRPGKSHNGLAMNGAARSDKEYNNALKFVNALRNRGTSKCIESLVYQNEENLKLCVARIKPEELNYTLNQTRLEKNGKLNTFSNTMNYEENTDNTPTSFANSIQIYDKYGYMVAVGNLSTPLKKDFNSEIVIKVVVPT
tara:strand:- start:56 stop:4465 length:4410 start_codon:yes stop_codon:yes gene_type:complete